MREVYKGAASQTQYVVLRSSTTGLSVTGKVFGDITGSYTRNRAARTAITMATLASASAAWSSGGLIEVDATNTPGLYRFDIPDAAFATGVDKVIVSLKCTGVIDEHIEFVLTDWNKQITHSADLGVLANNAIPAAALATGAITSAKFAANAVDAAALATDAVTEIQSGLATAANQTTILSNIAGVQADTDNIQTRLPAALVSGRMDSSIGATQANAINAAGLDPDVATELQAGLATSAALAAVAAFVDTEVAAILADTDDIQTRLPATLVGGRMDSSTGAMAAGVVTATAVATNAIDADALATDAVTEIAAAVPSAAAIATAVWGVLTSALTTVGSVGKLVVDFLDAAVSTRATPAQVNTEVLDVLEVDANTEITAVPAATTNLKGMIKTIFAFTTNKLTETSTTQTLRNRADSSSIGTAVVADDGSVATRGSFS